MLKPLCGRGIHNSFWHKQSTFATGSYLGRTIDETAAGEAFDKTAKMLGLPLSPARPLIDKFARKENVQLSNLLSRKFLF
jgi:tRNA A37 threonylcarbamoyltransferase TsaD